MNQNPPPPPGIPPAMPGALPPNERLATISMVLGIVSVTLCGCLAGLPAIICGHIAKGRIAQSGGTLGGNGQATTGLALGYVSILGSIIAAVIGYYAMQKAPAVQGKLAPELVKAQAASLTTALEKYRAQQGALPKLPGTNGEQVDTILLTGTLAGPGYYDPQSNGLVVSNVPSDPWFQPLNFAIDLNGDGSVEIGAEKVPGTVAVWSSGPNKQNESGTGDDVRSW